MKTATDLSLRVVASSPESAEVAVALDADFAGFEGHFPGAPVLPGMCHVDLAVRAASAAQGRALELLTIERARFVARVAPGGEMRCRLVYEPDGVVEAEHFVEDRLVAELRLKTRL
jgi:3-hydroxyacyl-[acyl-carrier-protein] dehydratase